MSATLWFPLDSFPGLLLTIAHESEENTWGRIGGANMAPIRVKDSRVPLTSFDPVSCPKAQIIIVPGRWKKGYM